MRIINVETLCLSRPHEIDRQWFTSRTRALKADCAIVKINTDEGLVGIGEACAYGAPSLISKAVEWLSLGLVGADPGRFDIVPHPNGRRLSNGFPFQNPYDCAVAGIDSALWDLRGKIEGKPVRQLLNSHSLNKVRLYASSGCRYDWRIRPEQVIEEALGYLEQGFTACKIRLGTEWTWDRIGVDRFLGLMAELSQTIEGRIELMLDGNARLNEEQALLIARGLEPLNFTWFEEPMPIKDVEGYAWLSRSVDLPISGGEQFTTLEEFRPYFESKAFSIVQPDAGCCGITELMKIAEYANHYGVDLIPHNWHNGLMTMANAHIVAALAQPRVLELCMIQGPLQWEILKEKPVITEGWLQLPANPGLGVELAENLETRFPYIEGHFSVEVVR